MSIKCSGAHLDSLVDRMQPKKKASGKIGDGNLSDRCGQGRENWHCDPVDPNLSVSAPFIRRCLTRLAVGTVANPHQTVHAVFPHTASVLFIPRHALKAG